MRREDKAELQHYKLQTKPQKYIKLWIGICVFLPMHVFYWAKILRSQQIVEAIPHSAWQRQSRAPAVCAER